jgi:5-(carboxyamino)imidazole ribonucleotide synthase
MLPDITAMPAGSTLGIVGGGQLGRMLAMSAAQMGFKAHIYNPEAASPAEEVASITTIADYEDVQSLKAFAASVDVVTVEFENIPASTAEFLAARVPFLPSPALFAICQHRRKEKDFIRSCGVGTAEYRSVTSREKVAQAVADIGLPCIAKHATQGYDGKGQQWIRSESDAAHVWELLGERELVVETVVPFACEASIIIARSHMGHMETFPIARNIHTDGILTESHVPAGLSVTVEAEMHRIAKRIAEEGDLVGLLAIECFVLGDESVLVNEMATRPHNSGHWTMQGCNLSQFDMLVRVCMGLPLITPRVLHPTTMHNIIGDSALHMEAWWRNPLATVHLYGKDTPREGRKMGHVNVVHPAHVSAAHP